MNTAGPLSSEQEEAFLRDGYLVARDAISTAQLVAARSEIANWVSESRAHSAPFGPPTEDGKPRFDLAAEHSAAAPALRRVNNPSDISSAYIDIMERSVCVDMVQQLVGPSIKFHHCKINLKLPGTATRVAFHQDFAFTPHTNDDVVTALIMIDDMTAENGCLSVVPGSHRGPVHSLFSGDTFTGFVAPQIEAKATQEAVPIIGPAGSVCLMHTRLLHGSEPNASSMPRGLYIAVYSAADAHPIARNPMPNPNEGRVLRGVATRVARMVPVSVEIPQQPHRPSFFSVQEEASNS
ncbi:MAG: phytanoyl-CoA dioxygenase family protein [Chromatiales bacterium]|jgi:ectoine hydroxylase-related dioxygenase (phytanoyl-CoA dioxygenase family)|nr:phytanoyl-CoA dioxygenase family protein [Chromatiales bacterium]